MPDLKNRVWWWNLDREGRPLDPRTFAARQPGAPPLKNGSPYTPNILVDGEFPLTHLHHRDGRIVGIHGEADLTHLRVTLLLCLQHEEWIIRELSGKHHLDIMLSDVLVLFV